MLLHEKITIIRKMNNLTQEGFDLPVSNYDEKKTEDTVLRERNISAEEYLGII